MKNSNPIIDNNRIAGPSCSNVMGTSVLAAAHFENSSATITNNVFLDQPCPASVDVVVLDNALGASSTLYNNTILFTTCSGCFMKRGLFVKNSLGTGILRNNIFVNAGTADFASGFAVYENTAATFQFFENSLLWAPNGGTLYWDEGASALSIAAINNLAGWFNMVRFHGVLAPNAKLREQVVVSARP